MSELTFILIPGAGGSAWYWHLVEPKLRQLGHQVVSVSLPAADDKAGLPEYAAAALHAMGHREPRDMVVVAQSLGGFTAPLVCSERRVALLVLLNAMIPKPGERPGEWWTNTRHDKARRQQNQRDGRPADAPFDPFVEFFHDVPQAVLDEVLRRGEPRQSETIFASACTFDSWPDVPTRVLIGRDDRFFPLDFQRRVALERLGISADVIPGGHPAALSQPEALVERLQAYVRELRPA